MQFKCYSTIIKKMKKITKLDLSDNLITECSYNESLKSSEFLRNLKNLNLNRNRFKEFPKAIQKCLTLIHLDLGNNFITKLSNEDFNNLKNLRNLKINYNELQELPDAIANLQLIRLNLNVKNLMKLPNVIKSIDALELLDLGYNMLHMILQLIISNPIKRF